MKKRLCSLLLAVCLLTLPASALTAEQAAELLREYYIDEVPGQVLGQPTVEAMLEALGDPYTTYYSAQEYADFMAGMEDVELVGLGIRYYHQEQGLLVDQLAPGSPAEEAGLESGDRIIEVDGRDIRAAAAEDAERWLKGEEGSTVRLTILRGEQAFQVDLTRRTVIFPTVILDKIDNGIAWISCSAFGPATFQQFYDIITAHDHQVDQWIVDLRGNGGGDLAAAVYSAGCFAGWDTGVFLRDGEGEYYSCLYTPEALEGSSYFEGDVSAFDENGYLTDNPVYVLTDAGTASASEFFCAIIRDWGAGLVIGSRTYGKGVAQSLFSQEYAPRGMEGYFLEGEVLKMTTERGYSVRGATCDRVGILPHFLVDAGLADEAAALLAAPVDKGEDALFLRDLSTTSRLVDDMVIPLDLLSDPANAQAAQALLRALPATASCVLRLDGEGTVVTVEQAAQACGVAPKEEGFSDVGNSPFAQKIETLRGYGIVSGPGDGTFLPEGRLDRASLCALLAKAMRYPLSGAGGYFPDVSDDAWYAPYVNALYELGVVSGYDDGLFHPGEPVTHEQFLAILGRTAQWLDMNYYELARRDGYFGDRIPGGEELKDLYAGYSDWVRELAWLCDDGLAWAPLAGVEALTPTTREEAAAGIFNLLRETGVLPG